MKQARKIFKRSVWAIVTLFFVILFVILLMAESAVIPYVRWIDNYFGVRRTFLVEREPEEGAEPEDTDYYPTKYKKYDENDASTLDSLYKMQSDALNVSERVNEEGMVLLWNRNGALPLDPAKETNVSTYGIMSLSYNNGSSWIDNWAYHATGSATTDLRNGIGFLDVENYPQLNVGPRLPFSLEKRGFRCNPSVLRSTWENGDKTQMNGYEAPKYTKDEVSWETLQNDTENRPVGTTADTYGDVVFYTVGRWTGEGKTVEEYVKLSEAEASVLKGLSDLRAQNKIKKLVLLIAFANPMDLNAFKDYDIDAALWVGNGGSTSTEAIADILVGNANPSGRLADTWVYDSASAPATVNYGNIAYGNSAAIDNDPDDGESSDKYVVYQEGIYVGYRYYETRYEDSVLGSGNANSVKGVVAGKGSWSYRDEVAYPFGHGNSYTTFAYSDYRVNREGDDFKVSMTVTNTGSRAGKEVMQVYLQKPYTEYDKAIGIEKSAVELVGYAKTDLLQPEGSQTLTVTVPEYEFKTYDSYGKKTYILERGDYYLAAGRDAHDALNNILARKGFTTANGMDENGEGELAFRVTYAHDDWNKYARTESGAITNRFDDADVNLYAGTSSQKITYLSRKDWNGTYPAAAVRLTATAEMVNALKHEQEIPEDPDDAMPVYGKESEEYGHLNLIQMRGVPYDDPLWDDFLNQLTFEEQTELLKGSMMPITSIAANEGDVYDGPIGLRDSFIGKLGARIAFPCSPIVASTYNDPLIEEMGKAFGEVARQHGRNGIWGVSTNIHRTPYNGRNNEYYSEDGFLAGKATAAATRGMVSKGILVYTKHFALNEIESVRCGVGTWANEQSIREIYLKAFEAGVTEADGNGIMTSYNRIGCIWTGAHRGLLTGVLRNEWGFTGVTCTDWNDRIYMGKNNPCAIAAAVCAGQDEWIYDIVGGTMDAYKNNATFCLALRESAHRNLYTRNRTSAMNGVGANTEVVIVIPAWQQAITTGKIVAGVLMGVSVAVTAACWALWFWEKRKA